MNNDCLVDYGPGSSDHCPQMLAPAVEQHWMLEYLPLVKRIVNQLSLQASHALDREDMEQIGLMGTFLGIFFCYCLFEPISNAMAQRVRTELSALECVRTTLVAHLAGKPTLLAVDAGRKLIEQDVKPAFKHLETWVTNYEDRRNEEE